MDHSHHDHSQHEHHNHDHSHHGHDHEHHHEGHVHSPGGTSVSDYLPLAIVFTYIVGGTALLAALTGHRNISSAMTYFMGLFFIFFSLFKVLDLPGFADGYRTYDLIAKRIKAYGYVYPFIELGLGVLYLLKVDTALLHAVTLVVMLVSAAGVARSLMKKQQIYCACLGNILKVPLSTISLWEDLLMALMALIMLALAVGVRPPAVFSSSNNSAAEHASHSSHTVKNEKEFLQMMVPHHEEAVATSQYLTEKSGSEQLKDFAQKVIDAQQAEIQEMKGWYRNWYGDDFKANANYLPMMEDLTKLEGEELDQTYSKGMIAHHEGAISMAEQALKFAEHQEVKDLANSIIAAQREEIELLQKMS